MPRMEDESTWPPGGVLPLVRPDGLFPESGYLLKGVGVAVYRTGDCSPKGLRRAEVTRYHDWQALVADGWRVAEGGAT